jgi:hypothetical protein
MIIQTISCIFRNHFIIEWEIFILKLVSEFSSDSFGLQLSMLTRKNKLDLIFKYEIYSLLATCHNHNCKMDQTDNQLDQAT